MLPTSTNQPLAVTTLGGISMRLHQEGLPMLSFPSKSPLSPQLWIDPLWATFSLRLWSLDQLETIPACSDAFPVELVLRSEAERGMFPCGYLMFYYRAIKIGFGISSTWLGQTGAKPVKIPPWYEAKFPALLSELLFTRPSYLYLRGRLLLGDGC